MAETKKSSERRSHQALQASPLTSCPTQAAALPRRSGAPKAPSGTCSILSSDSDTTSDLLARAFTTKAELAESGTEPGRKPPPARSPKPPGAAWFAALAAGKDQFPEQAARAQADYDCWMLYRHRARRRQRVAGLQDLAGCLAGAPGNRVPSGAAARTCRLLRRRPLRRLRPTRTTRSISTWIPGR